MRSGRKGIIKKVVKKRLGYSYEEMELFLAGVDPNEMKFNRTNCVDVGLECSGWGRVVVELRAEDI